MKNWEVIQQMGKAAARRGNVDAEHTLLMEAGYVRERQRVWRLRKQIKCLQKAIYRRNAYIDNLEHQVAILMDALVERRKWDILTANQPQNDSQMEMAEEWGTFRVGGTQ